MTHKIFIHTFTFFVLSVLIVPRHAKCNDSLQTIGAGRIWTLEELDTLKDRKWVWRDKKFDPQMLGDLTKFDPPDKMPSRTSNWKPHYPNSALDAKAEGTVWVRLLIDESGKVRIAHVSEDSGNRYGFEEAALDLAKTSHWIPAEKGGQKVPIWVAHEVKFRLLQTDDGIPVTKLDKWDWLVGYRDTTSQSSHHSVQNDIVKVEERPDHVLQEIWPTSISRPSLVYPVSARREGIEGSVDLKVLIGVDGRVKRALVSKAAEITTGFEEAALTAAIDEKWKPAMQEGKPVSVWIIFSVKFRLR